MTNVALLLGFAAGALAGLAHGRLLWRSSQRISPWTPLWGILRLGIVATVLAVAARWGQILPTASGWTVCFAASALWSWITHKDEPVGSTRHVCGTEE